jgi:cobalt/nickel transport protein
VTEAPRKQSIFARYWWVSGIVIALAMVFVLAPNASSDPDGLERVADDKEFIDQGEDNGYEWLPDYSIPGIENEYWSTVLSGAIGVAIMVLVVGGVAFALTRVRRTRTGAAG